MAIPRRRPRAHRAATSRSCAPRSGTPSTARSSTRSIRSSARSSASPRHLHLQRGARHGTRRLRLESQEPPRLPGRAAGARRQRHPPADHRGGHQPVRRTARADPPHVTGAIPIRRDTKDPAYLVTLKAYVAETAQDARPVLLSRRRPQLQRRAQGGQDRTASTPACRPYRSTCVIVPVAIAYDLVLEDQILAPQRTKRRQRPFSRELAEMVGTPSATSRARSSRSARPMPLAGGDGALAARRDGSRPPGLDAVGRLHKVLPTAIVATAMRPSMPRAELVRAVQDLIERLTAAGANLETTDGAQAVEAALELLEERGVCSPKATSSACAIASCSGTTRAQLNHLLAPPASDRRSHDRRDLQGLLRRARRAAARSSALATPVRHAHASAASPGGSSPARPSRRPSRPPGPSSARACRRHSTCSARASPHASRKPHAATRRTSRHRRASRAGHRAQPLAQAHAARPRPRPRPGRRQPAPHPRRGRAADFFVRIDMEHSPYIDVTLDIFETLWREGLPNVGVVLQSALTRSEGRPRARARPRRPRATREGRVQGTDGGRLPVQGRRGRRVRAHARALLRDGRYPAIATHDPDMIATTRRIAAELDLSPDRRSSSRCCTACGATCRRRCRASGLRHAGLHPVRPRVVPLLHASPRRTPRQRRVRPQEPHPRGLTPAHAGSVGHRPASITVWGCDPRRRTIAPFAGRVSRR